MNAAKAFRLRKIDELRFIHRSLEADSPLELLLDSDAGDVAPVVTALSNQQLSGPFLYSSSPGGMAGGAPVGLFTARPGT
jgi:hypothetical protein